jgi:sialate O-acetylesterase
VALHDKLQKPVGVIDAAVGGSAAETWMPMETFKSLSVYPAMEKRFEDDAAQEPGSLEKMDPQMEAWFKSTTPAAIEATCLAHGGRPMGSPIPGAPKDPEHPAVLHTPARFYNGMIHGLQSFAIKGVLWYQGDANSRFFSEYPELMKGLVSAWRSVWGADLPFYYVETQNMMAYQTAPVEDTTRKKSHAYTPFLREAQASILELPHTGVETAIDQNTGPASVENPHYPNKKPLGERLANLAAEEVYGQNLGEVQSPRYAGFKVEGDKVRISLTHAEGLRAIKGGELKGFAIRSGNGPWQWGTATIDGTDLLVSNPQVSSPTAVRYAWAQNPLISVENGAGLPLMPFRTDPETAPVEPVK